MERIRFIEHKGKQILHFDFTHARANEVIHILRDIRPSVSGLLFDNSLFPCYSPCMTPICNPVQEKA